MRCFLVDNGSLRPASWANLARVAVRVSELSGVRVDPASVLHSTRIPLEKIPPEAPPPITWERAIKAGLQEGEREFWVLPFFFGATGAITEYLPKREAALRERFGDFTVRYAPFLAEHSSSSEIVAPDLVDLLAERVRESVAAESLRRPPVILVDHGSPKREVAAVRDHLAGELAELLGPEVANVTAASMERREGPEYAFNEPLLETALRALPCETGPVVVAHLFLSPGRHAGEGGDIAEICATAEAERPGLRVVRTDLLGNHPRMPELVAARLEALRAQTSV